LIAADMLARCGFLPLLSRISGRASAVAINQFKLIDSSV